jgi:hypothetical protein
VVITDMVATGVVIADTLVTNTISNGVAVNEANVAGMTIAALVIVLWPPRTHNRKNGHHSSASLCQS